MVDKKATKNILIIGSHFRKLFSYYLSLAFCMGSAKHILVSKLFTTVEILVESLLFFFIDGLLLTDGTNVFYATNESQTVVGRSCHEAVFKNPAKISNVALHDISKFPP